MVLVAHALKQNGVTVLHIRENGEVESNDEAEERMSMPLDYPHQTLFNLGTNSWSKRTVGQQDTKVAWSESDGNANGDQGP
ncbi:MAG: hypothetical protein R3B46_15375 [Phycisphaerales bacterium]